MIISSTCPPNIPFFSVKTVPTKSPLHKKREAKKIAVGFFYDGMYVDVSMESGSSLMSTSKRS